MARVNPGIAAIESRVAAFRKFVQVTDAGSILVVTTQDLDGLAELLSEAQAEIDGVDDLNDEHFLQYCDEANVDQLEFLEIPARSPGGRA